MAVTYLVNIARVTWLNRDARIVFVTVRYVEMFEGVSQGQRSKRYLCGPDGFECVTCWPRGESGAKRAVESLIASGTWREA